MLFLLLGKLMLAGASPCITCHRTQVLGYQQNAMAHSLSHVARQPSGNYEHTPSKTTFLIKTDEGGTQITLSRSGLSAKFPVAYVIGSGAHASGDLASIGPYLFQAPVAYYSSRKSWGIAPGYENNLEPDFTRPVTAECLVCHAGRSRLVIGTTNRFEPLNPDEEAITCERCHGETAAHLQNPSRNNILNPRRLPSRSRDSICEQCHLSGEARVLNPGKQFSDFHAGEELENTLSVYVRDRSEDQTTRDSVKVIGHVEQLALSACSRKSQGQLWCGTCHNPHQKPADPVAYFRARCLSCHGDSVWKTHTRTQDDCSGCHMPKREARDGAHTVFTDHRIVREMQQHISPEPGEKPEFRNIVAWRLSQDAFIKRNEGIAYLRLGRTLGSEEMIQRGTTQAADALRNFPDDGALLTELGLVLLQIAKPADAKILLQHSVRAEPDNAAFRVNLANALSAAHQTQQAVLELEHALRLDPSLASAYRSLAAIYRKRDDIAGLLQTYRRYLAFMPSNIAVRIAIADLFAVESKKSNSTRSNLSKP